MSKILAPNFLQCSVHKVADSSANMTFLVDSLTAPTLHFAIDLESASFLFHISATTQGITGSLRAACSEPVQRFLACPFQLTKTDAPNTRVSLTLARSWRIPPGARFF
jgi:hypothetical protein